jgi:hypothetical protein
LVFGLCSLLLPLLSIPGVILGAVSLRRIGRNPSLRGRESSIAGIITSLTLGPLAAVAAVIIIVAALNQVDAPGFTWVPIHPDRPTPSVLPLPAALTLASSTPGAVVLPAQAKVIFDSMWTLRQEAFRSGNPSFMAEFETGPALEADEVTCGCLTRGPRGPIIHERLLVPKESSFPATFLGEATTTLNGSPYVQYLIISRPSAAVPWKVVSDPGYGGTANLDKPESGSGGFDGGAAASPLRAAAALPAKLAVYWQTWTDSGHAPTTTIFAPGRWTTDAGSTMAKAPQGAVAAFNGLDGHYRFQPGAPDEEWHFATSQGSITCGVVRAQTLWTSTSGDIYQPSSLKSWGSTVAPGLYKAAAGTDIVQPCFNQRPGKPTSITSGLLDPDTLQGVDLIASIPSTTLPSSVYGSPMSGQLQSGDSAIIGVDVPGNSLTLDTNGQDVRYSLCSSFRAVSPSGGELGFAALRIGDFAMVDVHATVPCLSRVSLLAAPRPPQCNDQNGNGHLDVVWVGSDEAARSIVYTEGNQIQSTVAMHWCQPPTVVAADGSATTLAAIPSGANVQVTFSGNVWVTGVTVEPPGSNQLPVGTPPIA